MRTIAIIGGGFSGTMTAVNLARFSDDPLHLIIINSKRPFGRGTAYGTSRPEHLLNVAARNMSAFPDYPLHFFEWLRSRSEFDSIPDAELREKFIPRMVYGDYIRGLAETYLHPVHSKFDIQLDVIEDEAVDIVWDDTDHVQILLKNQEPVSADTVLLATGNQPPASLASQTPLTFDRRYCADPWNPDFLKNLPAKGSEIVLLGTGLTMVDVVITLDTIGWQGKMTAISRNGMLPQSHFRGIAYPDYLPENAESLGLDQLTQLVEQHCRRLNQMSQNSAIAIDKLRPYTQRLWKSLNTEEKKTFLSDYAARWNVTRHRIAQSIHHRLTDRLDGGTLQIVPGSINSLIANERQIEVHYTNTHGQENAISGDFIINCTGPQSRFSKSNVPLFNNLLARGMVSLDDMDMGIEVDENFTVLNEQREPVPNLFAIGPLLKGSLWETTAVPELRGQAMRVAQQMLEQKPTTLEEEYVIEYCI